MSHAHGFQEPSSLPSDYAILSTRFGHDYDENIQDTDSNAVLESTDDEHEESDSLNGPSASNSHRKGSNNSHLKPAMAYTSDRSRRPSVPAPRAPNPTESTPLLNPEVPRIHEDMDEDTSARKRTMFWQELKILSKYSLPVFGTHVLEYSLVMASVVSIGHLGTTPLAAITLGTMTANVTAFSIFQGMVSALDTLLPPAWTSPQPSLVGLWTQRMVVVMAALLIPIFTIWMNAEGILLLLKQDPEVARLAALYLRWASMGLPAYAFNLCIRRYFQAQGLFAAPTRIIIVIAPINALLNYLLVWGPPGIRLGYIGAPIATAICLNLVSLASITYAVFFVEKTAWYPVSRRSFSSLGMLVHLGLGGVGQTASEWWAWELVALAASQLGPTALATQSILLSSASMTYQAPFALSVATSVRIGNLLGEQKAKRAGVTSSTSLVLAIIVALVWSTMFMSAKNVWAKLFNDDPEVVSLVSSIIPLVAFFQLGDGLAGVTAGILRARGKQVLGALLTLGSYYVVGIPFGIWLAFKIGMGLSGLWIGLTLSLMFCAVLGAWLCLKTDWEYEVKKVMKRFEDEQKRERELRGEYEHI